MERIAKAAMHALLGIKWGKAVKNCQKQQASCSFFESKSAIFSKKTSESLMSLFVKEQFALVTILSDESDLLTVNFF